MFLGRRARLARRAENLTTIWQIVMSTRKSQGERKIGRGSQIGAWHQDRLADWLSVVMWLWLRLGRVCGLVVKVPGYRTEMYCVFCEVRTEFIYVMLKKVDRLCGLVVRVPGYTTEMYCVSWEVRTEYICYVEESRPPLWSSGQSSWLHNGDVLCFLWGTNWIYICYVEESRPPLWSSGQSC
jgi:hypothetical protein